MRGRKACRRWAWARAVLLAPLLPGLAMSTGAPGRESGTGIDLPSPARTGEMPVERALSVRESLRSYGAAPLDLEALGQLLWAAQGTIRAGEGRTAPSAGALYPLEVYLVAGEVTGLEAGVYHYRPDRHRLVRTVAGDRREGLAEAALGQPWVRRAPAVLAISGVYARTTRKYGERGRRYVHIEVGHAAQSVYLQAEALGLATVMVGAFADREAARVLDLPAEESLLALMPVGWPP